MPMRCRMDVAAASSRNCAAGGTNRCRLYIVSCTASVRQGSMGHEAWARHALACSLEVSDSFRARSQTWCN